MWAIIGDTLNEFWRKEDELEELPLETPFGLASPGCKRIRLHGHECLFIPRQGERYTLLPSEINYRANIYLLKKYGVMRCIALSSALYLGKDMDSDVFVPTQYINWTRIERKNSFCGEGFVGHVSLESPVWKEASLALQNLTDDLSFKLDVGGTYLCIDGPHLPTQAEKNLYASMGASLVGMTAYPEYVLAREAGIAYLPCCFVKKDKDEKMHTLCCEHKLKEIAKHLFESCPGEESCFESLSLKYELSTDWGEIDREKRAWLEVVFS